MISRHCSDRVVVRSVAVGLTDAAADMWLSAVDGSPVIRVGRARPEGWVCVAPVAAVAKIDRFRDGWKFSVCKGGVRSGFLKSKVRFW